MAQAKIKMTPYSKHYKQKKNYLSLHKNKSTPYIICVETEGYE